MEKDQSPKCVQTDAWIAECLRIAQQVVRMEFKSAAADASDLLSVCNETIAREYRNAAGREESRAYMRKTIVHDLQNYIESAALANGSEKVRYRCYACGHEFWRMLRDGVIEDATVVCPSRKCRSEDVGRVGRRKELQRGDRSRIPLPEIEDLERLLSALPVRARAAVVLVHLEGYTTEEVAAEVGVSRKAVEQALQRAAARLKKYFEGRLPKTPSCSAKQVEGEKNGGKRRRDNARHTAAFLPAA